MGLNLTQTETGTVLCVVKDRAIKQWYNKSARRYYVTFGKNTELAEKFGRIRMFRSHFLWLLFNSKSEIPNGYVVHHKDHNRLNDEPENLQLMTELEHTEHHKNDKRVAAFAGKKHSEETKSKMRKIAKTRGNNDVWSGDKKAHYESTKCKMSMKAKGSGNAAFRADLNSSEVVAYYEKCGSIAATARYFGCSNTAVRNRIKGIV